MNDIGAISLGAGDAVVKADITNEAIDALGPRDGMTAVAIVKVTDVIVDVE
ncbi:hypothetical protein [Olsenella uli]|uniref:hypothetical protein n=1 Tax=Olsenella uli TaxID=133926 RepID=UPI00165183FE|nr:hypothetical protein [Olsenella uli]